MNERLLCFFQIVAHLGLQPAHHFGVASVGRSRQDQSLQQTLAQQASIKRQDQDLAYTLSEEQSPAYIAEHAKELGLVPADPKTVQVRAVPNLKPIPSRHEDMWP